MKRKQKNCIIVGLALSLVTCLLYILSLQTLPTIKPVKSLSTLSLPKRDQESKSAEEQPACVPVSYNTNGGVVRIQLNDGKFKKRASFLEHFNNNSRCERWRFDESIKLGELVQRRLEYLQNPKNCSSARKLVCEVHVREGCGFGCQVNTIAMCLMIGYATQRTVIVTPPTVASQLRPLSKTCMNIHGHNTTIWDKNSAPYQVVRYKMIENEYMPDIYPPAVPADLAKKIDGFHGNAFIWWAGQISKYIFRQSPLTLAFVKEAEQQSEFSHPIVGYSNYTVIFNNEIASSAGVEQRDGFEGQAGIIHDIYMLSKCDFLVCTFSSNVCRLAYQLLQTWHGDATNNVMSLDEPYLFCFARSDPLGPTLAVKMPTYDDAS